MGSITGVVIDASGAPVPGATVTVESKGRPARTTETTVEGRFTVDEASAGGTLRVRADGFAELVTPLNPSEPTLRVVLQPRPLTESVTVTASRGADWCRYGGKRVDRLVGRTSHLCGGGR